MDPLTGSLVVGGVNAVLGGIQGIFGASAQKQEYRNQLAFQQANTAYAQWQARFNQRATDANSQYQFWQQTLGHNQQLAYVNSLRNYELNKAIVQADIVAQTRAAAGADFVRSAEAVSQQMAEAAMRDAVAYQQFTVAALKARSQWGASGQEGASIDRMVNDFARQAGDYATIQAINQGLRSRQYTRQQAAAVAQYLSAYNSQQFYAEQPYLEPVAPFQPLPSLLAAPAPTMTGAGPSAGAGFLNVASGVMGGIGAGLSTYTTLSGLASSGKPAGGG
ncbi:MAG: hypothetical protein VKI42_01085 [Synechococcaceae cyanobacterium]|nr:hypothetical protein [Synechococcaceae cyanobacterium]